jgi:hypothetical protein
MNIAEIKSVHKLSVIEIDQLISQLEEGNSFILHELKDFKKYHKLSEIIGFLIDVRCEKMGIKL